MTCLNKCYHHACHDLAINDHSTDAQGKIKQKGVTSAWKGKIATLQPITRPHAENATESQELRKLRRRPARLYELQKQARKSFDDDMDRFTLKKLSLFASFFLTIDLFIFMNVSNFVGNIFLLAKIRGSKFLRSAKLTRSLGGKLEFVNLIFPA